MMIAAAELAERAEIVALSVRYASGIDRRDWSLYRSCFTDVCAIDFSSWSARPAGERRADEWVDAVRRTNGSFDATQHLMANHVVTIEGDRAASVYEVQAQHWFTPETLVALGHGGIVNWCTLGGHYTSEVVRAGGAWRISALRLDVRWQTGNPDIFPIARARGAEEQMSR
jgi:SnoaL-like domain